MSVSEGERCQLLISCTPVCLWCMQLSDISWYQLSHKGNFIIQHLIMYNNQEWTWHTWFFMALNEAKPLIMSCTMWNACKGLQHANISLFICLYFIFLDKLLQMATASRIWKKLLIMHISFVCQARFAVGGVPTVVLSVSLTHTHTQIHVCRHTNTLSWQFESAGECTGGSKRLRESEGERERMLERKWRKTDWVLWPWMMRLIQEVMNTPVKNQFTHASEVEWIIMKNTFNTSNSS